MSETNQNHYSHLFQVEDKQFKAIMIFNLFRMALSAILTLISFDQLLFLLTNGYSFYSIMSFVAFLLYIAIFFSTITLKKQTVLFQVILLIISFGIILMATMEGAGQFPFMDIAMTYAIYHYRHFFTK